MLFVQLERADKRTYTRQIYSQCRRKIVNGELMAGEKLPSTRELSEQLHIARNTVLTAYDMLIAEGLVRSTPGSGVYVLQSITIPEPPPAMLDYSLPSLAAEPLPPETIVFDSGIPALDLFPRHQWQRLAAHSFAEAPVSALGYDDPQGRPELRQVLAGYLKNARGIQCHPDQIIITTGAKQGLSLVAKCLLQPDSEVWLEDPSNANVKQIFSYHTSRIIPLPVDHEGVQPERFPQTGKPAFIFVTPSHQFPLGGILPLSRRKELIRFARQNGCYLVEDDYDSEFRYDGVPVHALHELDPERVIYTGTFSKVLFPSLRLGYLVLPYPLVAPCRELKRLSDHHSNSIWQLALMRFIETGALDRHIRRMRKIYRKRRDALLALLEQYFPRQIHIYGAGAGMHVVAAFDGVAFSPSLLQHIKAAGVYMVPVENHAIKKGQHLNHIILGYAHLTPAEMEQGLARLKQIIASQQNNPI